MSRIIFGTLVFALGLASVSFAVEPSRSGYQPFRDQIPAIQPSGLRFTGANYTVRTGNVDGGNGYGPCNCGDQAGYCAHWTLIPWVSSWDEPHHRGGYPGGASCCNYGF